jgi:quercetin 2,3-dioxygenase
VHLLQIWMLPEKQGLKPAYYQKNFTEAEKRGKLRLVASPDGREGSVKIRQKNELYATVLGPSDAVTHELQAERHAYVQVPRGSVTLNGNQLNEGDGAAISAEKSLELRGSARPKSCCSTSHNHWDETSDGVVAKPNLCFMRWVRRVAGTEP